MSLKKLNLGSGPRKLEGYINIDIRPEADPDIVHDVETGLPYKDNYFDEVRAWDFLEHIRIGKTIFVMEEIYRVLKHGGMFESFTPDAEMGQGAFQDPTHMSFWVANSWLYYSDVAHRDLYNIKATFCIMKLKRITSGNSGVYHLHVLAKAIK